MTARPTIKRSRKILFSSWFLAGCCLLLLPDQWTDSFQFIFRRAFHAPLQFGYGLPSLASPRTESLDLDPVYHADLARLQQENRELQNHLLTLRAELADLATRFDTLAGIPRQSGWERMARVSADAVMALSPGHLVINRGRRDGLQEGLYAIVDNAVVGRLVQVGSFESELLLTTHAKCSVSAFIQPQRTDTEDSRPILGKLDGTGDGRMRMRVRGRSEIRVGDPVHIGRQRFLEIPIIVGYVTEYRLDKDEPLMREVLVEPAASQESIRGVFVLCFVN